MSNRSRRALRRHKEHKHASIPLIRATFPLPVKLYVFGTNFTSTLIIMEQTTRHQCMIYAGAPSEKLPALAGIMCKMMEDGYRCLYLNSPAMVAGIRSCLSAMGIDVALQIAATRLVLSSEPVSTDEDFDVTQMLQKLEDALDDALMNGFKGLWASGDMTWELGSEKNVEKLIEYEWELDALFQRRKELVGVCQYHQDTLPAEAMREGLLMHRGILINETISRLNPYYINSVSPSDGITTNILLDKMIAELCQANSETRR